MKMVDLNWAEFGAHLHHPSWKMKLNILFFHPSSEAFKTDANKASENRFELSFLSLYIYLLWKMFSWKIDNYTIYDWWTRPLSVSAEIIHSFIVIINTSLSVGAGSSLSSGGGWRTQWKVSVEMNSNVKNVVFNFFSSGAHTKTREKSEM